MYLSDLRVYFKVRRVFQSNLKEDGGVLKSQKKLVACYANTTNVEFIVDRMVLAELSRARNGAPWVRKFGKLSNRENLVMT